MISGGNSVVSCPHPGARRVSNLTIDLMHRAARRAGAPHPLFHSVEQPTIEVAQAMLKYKGIRLNVVTGGPGVVKEALAAGKKAITAGPGNPPSVVRSEEHPSELQPLRQLVGRLPLEKKKKN